MEFKEFLENEEAKFFDIGLDLSADSKNESILGLVKGGWNTLAGGMTAADELIAKAMGDGTKGRMRSGLRQMGRGLRQITIGDPPKQPISSSPRQTQQNNNPNTPISRNSNAPASGVGNLRKIDSPEDRQTRSFLRDLSRQERGLSPQPEEWKQLASMYKVAKTSEERKAIRKRMREVSPQLYQQAVERGMALKRKVN